ncbi:hypothetical protein SCHPADRAFT_947550 [Schizopora paradoxa]|uniref:Uncharacterized protein n=1 Tax=Schizopora paradoxa TaxID=27342 RepID=A0A0H2QYJ9_9AGAM|nr:hypothetical protein SCHPADRAFT_947550 [Schizopora paradoxa]
MPNEDYLKIYFSLRVNLSFVSYPPVPTSITTPSLPHKQHWSGSVFREFAGIAKDVTFDAGLSTIRCRRCTHRDVQFVMLFAVSCPEDHAEFLHCVRETAKHAIVYALQGAMSNTALETSPHWQRSANSRLHVSKAYGTVYVRGFLPVGIAALRFFAVYVDDIDRQRARRPSRTCAGWTRRQTDVPSAVVQQTNAHRKPREAWMRKASEVVTVELSDGHPATR